ncbi:uncharacterized protein LOC133185140 [Saccostrea echinata]|uniref:uncharacterized protein LOC133185140 n=1 Tax=Saccostrea echinata TaxID=191078 RepID=UPI002A83D865|nr:uncharacterized protein LOC133185140 [Saccostrea echinata]
MAKMGLWKNSFKVGFLFVMCCGVVYSDSEDDTGTTSDNSDSGITLATTVSYSAGEHTPPPQPIEDTYYKEEDDNMNLFGGFLTELYEKENVAKVDDGQITSVPSTGKVTAESTGHNAVQEPNFVPDVYMYDSEEEDDLDTHGGEFNILEKISEQSSKRGSGSDGSSSASSEESSSSENNAGGSDGDLNGKSDSMLSSSGVARDSYDGSTGSDSSSSESKGGNDVNRVSGELEGDEKSNNGFRLAAPSGDSSDDSSNEDSGEGSSKTKNCKCKEKGGDGENNSGSSENGYGSNSGGSGSSDSGSSGSFSGNTDEDLSRGGRVGDQGDSSSEESYYDSSYSEEHSSSESVEEPENPIDSPNSPDSPKQGRDNGLNKERKDYGTSIHRLFQHNTNTLVKVVNRYSSDTPSGPQGNDLSRNFYPRISTHESKSRPPIASYIVPMSTTPPPVSGGPPSITEITRKVHIREYLEPPVIRDYNLTPKTSFWLPPDVAKPPEWQDQKEWINIKIDLEKPAHWIEDPNSNGSIPRWNIPYIPPDWFKKQNEKLTTQLHFELTTPGPNMVHWSPKPNENDRTTHVPEYLARKRVCDRKFDIVLAIDGTGNEKDFGYLKGALVQLLDRLIMGENKVQVGVVLLGNNDALQIPVSGDRSELEDRIARLGLPEDSNRYDIALKSAGELVETQGRKGVSKVIIMIVNDKSRYDYYTQMEAARLHRRGISVFTVGVGYNTNEEELKLISSSENEIIRVKNYVHLVYLMTGYVQLFCNVEDNYLPPPTLAPPQQTVTPKGNVITKLTTDVNSEPTPREAKILCEGCKMTNGAGFNSHPNECNLFVHCYYGELGRLRAMIQRCPFGQFWNQTILSCQYSERSYCPVDRCSYVREKEYEEPENCRAFWECSNGYSIGRCCRFGFHYVKGEGCVRDVDRTCRKSCPLNSPVELNSYNTPTRPVCDKIPIANDRQNFKQLMIGIGYVTMPCPEGTQYNERKCTCAVIEPGYPTFKATNVQKPVAGCTPEVKLNFNNGVTDASGKWTYISNENVDVQDGMAVFNGKSRLLIPRFTNVDFGKTLVIRLRYKELEKLEFNESQALINNGDCGDVGSIQVFTKRNSVGYTVKTTRQPGHVALQLHKPHSEWKDVEYIVSDGKLEGVLNGAHASKSSLGAVESRQCALQVGFGPGHRNFRGHLSMLEIYLCKPEKAMKYS